MTERDYQSLQQIKQTICTHLAIDIHDLQRADYERIGMFCDLNYRTVENIFKRQVSQDMLPSVDHLAYYCLYKEAPPKDDTNVNYHYFRAYQLAETVINPVIPERYAGVYTVCWVNINKVGE
ncbi:MAG: hypothetical protein JNM36_18125 [Chitinophagales bacterium]|nr:hypothetical protein [Chitinophagales bacterium]